MKELNDETKAWIKRAFEHNYPHLENSAVFLSVYLEGMAKDPTPCLQLGMAVLMDKPIIVVAEEGQHIPENLRKVAKAITTYKRGDPLNVNAHDSLARAIKDVVGPGSD